MSVVMLRRAASDVRPTVLWYALGLLFYGVLISLYYPTFRDSAASFQEIIDRFPPALLAAFGIGDLTSFPGFIGAEFLNLMWPLIVGIFVIMTGAGLVAQEIERGTVEFWLSVPETRMRLLLGKVVAFALAAGVLVLVTLLSLVVGGALVDETVGVRELLATGVVLLAFAVAVGGYSVLFSSFANDRGRPAGMAAGLTLAFYLVWLLSTLSERWDWLRYLSIFTAFEPQEALESGAIPLGVLVLFGIGVVSTLGALAIFQRRDVIA